MPAPLFNSDQNWITSRAITTPFDDNAYLKGSGTSTQDFGDCGPVSSSFVRAFKRQAGHRTFSMTPHRAVPAAWLLCFIVVLRPACGFRELKQDSKSPGPEQGLVAGDPIPCEFLVFFDPSTNTSVDTDIKSVLQHLQLQEISAASVDEGLPPPPLNITTVFGRVGKPAGDDWLYSLNSSTTRPESQNCTEGDESCRDFPPSRYVKAVLLSTCSEDPVGAQLLQGIAEAPVVSAVVANRVISSQQVQQAGDDSALLVPAMGRVSPTAAVGTSWPGCLNPGMALAWWGRRCADARLTEWMGVYAFFSSSGKVVEGCVKQRQNLTPAEADVWLGRCGVSPKVAPSPLQAAVCTDLKNSSTPTYSQQASFVHPNPKCGKGARIKMTFSGSVCRVDPDIGASLLQWTSAKPVANQKNVAKTGCELRLRGKGAVTAEDAKKYLGECGEAPASVTGLKICAAARARLIVPPDSPRPPNSSIIEVRRLDMEWRRLGEADPIMLKRIRAVTANDTVPAESNWKRGKPAAVAVIDSGVYCEHPDLNVVYNMSVFPFRDGCYDPYGHGTHVAGLIGARNNGYGVLGAAPAVLHGA